MNKIRRAFLALLFLPSLAGATKIVSQQLGNWGDGSTWVGGVVPGNGDEVSLFHVISATDTRTIGVSLSSGSFAVTLNSTGAVHITSTGHLIQRGYGTYTAGAGNLTDALTVDGGGAMEFDASASTSPTTLHYGFYPSGASGFRKFKVSGSSTSYASIYNTVVSTVATLGQNGQANGGVYELLYGSATRILFQIAYNNGAGSSVKWDAQHSSFTSCATINPSAGGNMFSSSVFRHEYNYHTNTAGATIFSMNFTSFNDGTGVRSIKGNIFDANMSTLGMGDFIIADNFMGSGWGSNTSTWTLFTNNFVRTNQATANLGFAGPITDSYMWWDDDQQNPHVLSIGVSSGVSISGSIWGQSGRSRASGADDSGEFYLQGGPGRISTTTVTNCILLPNGAGYSSLQITSLLGTSNPFTYLNNRADIDHNTYFGGWDSSVPGAEPPFSAVNFSETSNMGPGTLDSFRSNLLWNTQFSTQPANYFKTLDAGNVSANLAVGYGVGPTQDVCNPARCDYNGSFGVTSSATFTNSAAYLNQGRGYIGNYSSTPGVHDVDAQNPRFVDYRRSVEMFDSKYWRPHFGLAQPTGWNPGASYFQGDIVSHSSSTYYWSESINYVYISSGFCVSPNPEPGVIPVRSWNKCWQFQSIEDIKQAIISSTTFTDSTIGASNSSVNQTLLKWIQAGYAPTNTAYRGTAHDGGDIGAVAFVQPSSDPLDPTFFPSIDQTASHYSTALGSITVTDSLYKVMRSSVVTPNGANWFIGYAMKNEIQSIQVHVSPSMNIQDLNITMSNLVDTQTAPTSTIYASTPDVTIYREFYLNVSTPSCLSTSTFMGGLRDYMPDILIPEVDPYWKQTTNAFPVPVLSTQTQSAWIDVHIPTSAPSGYYTGNIWVSSGGVVVQTIPVVIGVWNWLMPSTATLPMAGANFNRGIRNVSYGGSGTLNATYPNSRGSDNFADTVSWIDGQTQLLDNRWTAYGMDNIFAGDFGAGAWANFIPEYGPLLNGTPTHPQSSYHIQTILPGAAMNMFRLNVLNAGRTDVSLNSAVWQDWVSTFTAQGWIDRLAYKLIDEPSSCCWGAAITTGTITRTLSTPIVPNVVTTSLSDATVPISSGASIIDYITPLMSQIDTRTSGDLRSTYDNYLTLSSGTARKIGSYIDCVQGGTCANGTIGPATTSPWPNRMIDGTPVANRAFETWLYKDRIDFELYFAIDYCDDNPTGLCAGNSSWHSVYAFGNHGDGTIMYPSTATYVTGISTPIWCPSMRLKHFRDGSQDYEYEHYLSTSGYSTFVSTWIATWMQGGHNFSNDPAGIRTARIAMGNQIHQFSLTSSSIPAITSNLNVSGTIGVAFNYQITATTTSLSFNALGLPAGLVVNTLTGAITGIPLTTGVTVSTISATNANGTGNAALTITIVAGIPTITSDLTGSGAVGSAFNYQIVATNIPTSYNATPLPNGLSVNALTGLISGTPITVAVSTCSISAINSAGSDSELLTITISAQAPSTPTERLQGSIRMQGGIQLK